MKDNKELFTKIDNDLLIELHKLIFDFVYIDPEKVHRMLGAEIPSSKNLFENVKPEFADFSGLNRTILELWKSYFSYATIQGKPKNKKGTNHFDTSSDRRKNLTFLLNYLGHKPTSADFKNMFELDSKFDEILEIIDQDIKSLLI